MTDREIHDLKQRARLVTGLDGRKLRHGQALDQLARAEGFANWGALLASHRKSLADQQLMVTRIKGKR